jgi:hypothetical protein
VQKGRGLRLDRRGREGSGQFEPTFQSPLPARRGGLGRGAVAEREDDGVEDGDRLAEDEIGRKAEHRDAPSSEEGRSAEIVVLAGRFEVLTAVELHGQVSAGAVEVQDVWAAGVLTPKLEAKESLGAEPSPQRILGVGASTTQSATASKRDVHGAVFGMMSSPLLT